MGGVNARWRLLCHEKVPHDLGIWRAFGPVDTKSTSVEIPWSGAIDFNPLFGAAAHLTCPAGHWRRRARSESGAVERGQTVSCSGLRKTGVSGHRRLPATLAGLIITAVIVEGRSQGDVARDYGVSKGWVSNLLALYRVEGDAAFEPGSRRPESTPAAITLVIRSAILDLRDQLTRNGLNRPGFLRSSDLPTRRCR